MFLVDRQIASPREESFQRDACQRRPMVRIPSVLVLLPSSQVPPDFMHFSRHPPAPSLSVLLAWARSTRDLVFIANSTCWVPPLCTGAKPLPCTGRPSVMWSS